MFIPQSISEQMLFSTVRIEAIKKNGEQATGTAFFFSFELDQNRSLPVLITNKHVIKDTQKGSFYVHEATTTQGNPAPSGKSFSVVMDDFEKSWFLHPNPQVDLCAMPVQPLLEAAEAQGKKIYNVQLPSTIIPTQKNLEDLRAVENVLMVGYPIGLWDTVNNLPIVRRGITATHPAIDFSGKPISVIDMACFPGSSGSPVLLLDEGSYINKAGTTVLGSNRVFLLGVLYAGPRFTANGEIIVKEIPTATVSKSITPVMIHLGYIAKAKEVLTLGEELKKHFRNLGANIP